MTMKQGTKKILEQFCNERMLAESSRKMYSSSIKNYTDFQGVDMETLIKEAIADEDKGVGWRNRRLRQRLLDYRTYLSGEYLKHTADIYLRRVFTVYKHFEIELHALPVYSDKNLKENPPITFDDIPTKELLQKALEYSNNLMEAVILFMTSSGCAKKETLNLRIMDFIEANGKNITTDIDIIASLLEFTENKEAIPQFKLRRQKTNRHYYTFCSPEANHSICNYLLSSNRPLTIDSKLFKIGESTFTLLFAELNDKLNLGMRGTRHKLTSHMLRKYHATVLNNIGILTDTEVHFLQGRARNQLDEIYLLKDPQILKDKYSLCLPKLEINWREEVLTRESLEYQALLEENRHLKETLHRQDDRLNKVESILNSKSDIEWERTLHGR